MKTDGISPKAIAAALGPILPGVVLLIIALVTGDEQLRNYAIGLLSGGGVAGGAAYRAKPGKLR